MHAVRTVPVLHHIWMACRIRRGAVTVILIWMVRSLIMAMTMDLWSNTWIQIPGLT